MQKADCRLAVIADPPDDPALAAIAMQLANDLQLPTSEAGAGGGGEDACEGDMLLAVTAARLELRIVGDRGIPVYVDLSKVNVRSNAGRTLKQPIARAVGLRKRSDLPIHVIDATAGHGEDAYLLKSLGCHVTAIERNGVVAALLRDGLKRAGVDLSVITADARLALGEMQADVVFLDPMFPAGRKTAERKAMVVLRRIVGDDADADALLDAALAAARKRVVVKRPPRAEPLAGRPPAHTHRGKAMRYDVYINSK